MRKYRTRPVEVEAVQFSQENGPEVMAWCAGVPEYGYNTVRRIGVPTSEGFVPADLDDWVVRDIIGGFHVCTAELFEVAYEEVKEVNYMGRHTCGTGCLVPDPDHVGQYVLGHALDVSGTS